MSAICGVAGTDVRRDELMWLVQIYAICGVAGTDVRRNTLLWHLQMSAVIHCCGWYKCPQGYIAVDGRNTLL